MTHSTKNQLSQARTIVNRLALGLTVSTLLGASAWAQSATADIVESNGASTLTYSFQNVVFKGDTFLQLLGINKNDTIAGYHGSGADPAHPNQGEILTLPNSFTSANIPHSVQTQVIGINDSDETAGFFVDSKGVTHGFLRDSKELKTIDYPGFTFTQLLGVNNYSQAAGYYQEPSGLQHPFIYDKVGRVFLLIQLQGAVGGGQATGITDQGWVSGFYVDAAGKNRGFALIKGALKLLDYPGSTFTQALGIRGDGTVVGVYMDAANLTHGFVFNSVTGKWYQVDDPNGIGTTTVNGIGPDGKLVGFYVDSNGNTDGLVATPIK